jgi:hypothetical protein
MSKAVLFKTPLARLFFLFTPRSTSKQSEVCRQPDISRDRVRRAQVAARASEVTHLFAAA